MTFIFAPPRARNRPRSRFFLAAGVQGRARSEAWLLAVFVSLGILTGCNRMITSRQTQLSKNADARAAEGDYTQAINLYESALDGTPGSAEIHYKLALIYD